MCQNWNMCCELLPDTTAPNFYLHFYQIDWIIANFVFQSLVGCGGYFESYWLQMLICCKCTFNNLFPASFIKMCPSWEILLTETHCQKHLCSPPPLSSGVCGDNKIWTLVSDGEVHSKTDYTHVSRLSSTEKNQSLKGTSLKIPFGKLCEKSGKANKPKGH